MFPVSDVIPSRSTPVVTIAVIAAAVFTFLWGVRMEAGGSLPVWLAPVAHASWLQLTGNALALWIFGDNVEDAMGRPAYVAFFAAASLAGVGAHTLAAAELPPPGAGAPVAAVVAAYLVLYPRSQVLLAVFAFVSLDVIEIPALYVVAGWVLALTLGTLTAPGKPPVGISVFAPHAAAIVLGAIVGLYLRRRVRWQ